MHRLLFLERIAGFETPFLERDNELEKSTFIKFELQRFSTLGSAAGVLSDPG